jgi:large subunit ribosomal protein L9
MELILLEKVKNLGDLGDTVKVKPGYGRNFLLPKGKALPATEENRKVFEVRKAELIKKAEASLNASKMRAEKLSGLTVTVRALAAEEGRLYGSVGPSEIARAVTAKGTELQRSEIDLPGGPIRTIGTYPAVVRLHSEVSVDITVVVEEEKA